MPCPSPCPKSFWHQTFCSRPKDDFDLANSVFVPAQNCLKWHKMQFNFTVWLKKIALEQIIFIIGISAKFIRSSTFGKKKYF